MNYDEMSAGREMDALVAERVMGWICCDQWKFSGHGLSKHCTHDHCFPPISGPQLMAAAGGVPHYSTDIAAAMQVFHALRFDCIWGAHNGDYAPDVKPAWFAGFLAGYDRDLICWKVDYRAMAGSSSMSPAGETIPLAICRAALKAVAAAAPKPILAEAK